MPGTNRTWIWILTTIALFSCSLLSPNSNWAAEAGSAALLDQVIEDTRVDRGLCSILGFDAEAALQLVRSGSFLIHVRHPDGAAVQELRNTAEKAGYGIDQVVIEQGSLEKLPYANNVVDLLVATKMTLNELDTLKIEEVMRVLRPEGVAVIGNIKQADSPDAFATKLKEWSTCTDAEPLAVPNSSFIVVRKRLPEGIDEWSHWEKSPDNNPVSTDQNIKAPYMTQFLAEPYYICMPAITTAAGGRTFLATGHIAHHRREWEMVNQLIARNGYNGTVLWQRKLPEGFMSHRSAFVATKDTFHLLDGNGCLLLDAATGEEKGRITIPDVQGDWKWMALRDGILYVLTGSGDGEAKVILGDRTFGGWSWADLSEGYYRRPRVPWGFGNTIAAYHVAEKRLVWKHEEKDLIDSRALAMKEDKIFLYCPERHFRCLTIDTGEILWTNEDSDVRNLIEQPGRGLVSTPGFRSACIAVASEDALILQGQTRMNVVALSTISGSLLWTKKKFTNNPNAIFIDGNAVLGVGDRGSHVVLNPVTGEVLEDLNFRKVSCTRLTASSDSLFVRGEGTLRFDRDSKKVLIDGGIRPACNDGVIPAHGLLYVGPWACDCNLSLIGAMAKCSAGDFPFDYVATEEERLLVGDGDIETVAPFAMDKDDWSTYRADNQRSASTDRRLATPNQDAQSRTAPTWAYAPDLETVPTPPVTAGNMVFVAGDDGVVKAISVQNGQLAWKYATAGPIKVSPTIWEGRVYVGSGDGYAYALEAATGRLLWRFQAAPVDRYIMVYGNLCSTWPVNSGVLVEDGVAYFAAGIIDHDGTYVYAIDARSGQVKWQNNSSGHLNAELRKGISVQGNLAINGDQLLMAAGNQTSPARFDLATGECLNPSFSQGQPKVNHGKFVGVIEGKYPVAGGRVLYASPRNVANKDSFVVLRDGRPMPLSYGGVPPVWNQTAMAMVNFRNGKLSCYEMDKTGDRLAKGFSRTIAADRPGGRWQSLADALDADQASLWKSDLNSPNKFEVLALAATPDRVAAIVQVQLRHRAHPQFQVQAFGLDNGTPAWFWQHDLPLEPLPEGLAVGSKGQLIVTTLQGHVISLGPKQPRPPAGSDRARN